MKNMKIFVVFIIIMMSLSLITTSSFAEDERSYGKQNRYNNEEEFIFIEPLNSLEFVEPARYMENDTHHVRPQTSITLKVSRNSEKPLSFKDVTHLSEVLNYTPETMHTSFLEGYEVLFLGNERVLFESEEDAIQFAIENREKLTYPWTSEFNVTTSWDLEQGTKLLEDFFNVNVEYFLSSDGSVFYCVDEKFHWEVDFTTWQKNHLISEKELSEIAYYYETEYLYQP